MNGTLAVTGDPEADKLLNENPLALLTGMLLDQQVPMEWAFTGPKTLHDRLGHLDASKIAAMSEDDLVAICVERPAIHRFPGSMGRRIHAMCKVLEQEYQGQAEKLWADVADGKELAARLRALPGFGEEKTKIFVALLAKTQGVTPEGWEQAAGKFADGMPRSVADIRGPDTLAEVRNWKRAQKAAKRDKQDRPTPA